MKDLQRRCKAAPALGRTDLVTCTAWSSSSRWAQQTTVQTPMLLRVPGSGGLGKTHRGSALGGFQAEGLGRREGTVCAQYRSSTTLLGHLIRKL